MVRGLPVKRGHPNPGERNLGDGPPKHYPTGGPPGRGRDRAFCLVDDAYRLLNPNGDGYGALKRLSDSEVLALALFQQLRGVESEHSLLRDAERFFAHLFPGVVGLHPSPFTAGCASCVASWSR